MREWFAAILDVFPNWNPVPRQMRELGQVVVVAWQVVRFRASIVSFSFFRTEADALESVGLED